MIHSIAVPAGEDAYAVAAQDHAVELARRFRARLRVVIAFDASDQPNAEDIDGESPRQLAERSAEHTVTRARDLGLHAESAIRGEGILNGLLAEARAADLLVLGIPTREQAQNDRLADAILDDERPLFDRAESMVMIVSDPPQGLDRILVHYQGGVPGKQALRVAGELAERIGCPLVVASSSREELEAEVLTGTAEEYLAGFGTQIAETAHPKGGPGIVADLLEIAVETEAGLIVLGGEPRNLIERLFSTSEAEDVALATRLPVLIAR
jgi:nucleotide-binding universal stress UspA family protein